MMAVNIWALTRNNNETVNNIWGKLVKNLKEKRMLAYAIFTIWLRQIMVHYIHSTVKYVIINQQIFKRLHCVDPCHFYVVHLCIKIFY